MNPENHERLASGIATGQSTSDDETYSVRIVPIPEGETTTGLSGEPTHWPRETLEGAVHDGSFQGAKLLKSPGGDGHKAMSDLADPDNIVGRVTGADYEEGVGPVLDAELIDEQMARLVEHDLVGVSPDMFRELGEFDEQLEAAPATQIFDVPYITILDRGASPGATIEPAEVEALAASDAGQYLLDDDTEGGATGDTSDVTGDGSGAEETTGAGSSDETDTGSDGGAGGGEGQGDGGGADGEDSDEPMGAAADADSPADADDTSYMADNPNERIQELQEQLAAAKQETENLREEKQELESETSELEETVEEKEARLEETQEELEQTEAELEEKEEEAESFGRVLAQRLAGEDTPFEPDELADRYTTEELADKVVAAEGLADDDERADDDYDPVAAVQEQLASSPAHRGEPTDETPEGHSEPNEEQLAAANDWAYEALSGSDIVRLGEDEQLSPRELAQEKTGVDPAECRSRDEFVRKAAADGGDD